MSKSFRLLNYDTRYDPQQRQLLVLVSGHDKYYTILRNAFSGCFFSKQFPDHRRIYNWGTYIRDVGEDYDSKVKKLLELLKQTVCIDDALLQTFALDYHMRPLYEEGKTLIGELVYAAKYQKDREKAAQLTELFGNFVVSHPQYIRSDFLIAVPPSQPNKPLDLPDFWVKELCTKLGMKNGCEYVRKIKKTNPMKDIKSLQVKSENIRGAFEITPGAPLKNCLVTIIDDIYQSGETLHELATTLQMAGATVQGLTATKTVGKLT